MKKLLALMLIISYHLNFSFAETAEGDDLQFSPELFWQILNSAIMIALVYFILRYLPLVGKALRKYTDKE